MSVISPRGRHRAPSKLSTTFNSTARVSAAVAVTGGIVASIAAPQAAQAADGVATISAAPAVASHSVPQAAQARQLLAEVVKANPQLSSNVQAKSLVVQQRTASTTATVSQQVRPRTSSVSSATPRSASAQRSSYQAPAQTQAPAQPKAASNPAPSASGIVGIAQRYLGTPYVFGGSSPAGFDCSGLTQYVYAQAGISIPRTATAQMLAATLVSNPQPGDLVFFGSSSYAYHVGIYVGNGMMIAAPKPGDVVKLQSVYTTPVAYGRF